MKKVLLSFQYQLDLDWRRGDDDWYAHRCLERPRTKGKILRT